MAKFLKGMGYAVRGITLFFEKPALMIYPVVPVCIALVTLVLGIIFGFEYLSQFFQEHVGLGSNDSWWMSAVSILWSLLILTALLFGSGYFFVSVAKIFAAPFNDILSEKIEILSNPEYKEPENWFSYFMKTIIPTVVEELKKFTMICTGFLIIFATFLIPVVNIFSGVLVVFYSIFVISLDFTDYPLARRMYTFKQKIEFFNLNRAVMLGFGTSIFLLFLIPFMQLLIMPVAVVGGTLLFIESKEKELLNF